MWPWSHHHSYYCCILASTIDTNKRESVAFCANSLICCVFFSFWVLTHPRTVCKKKCFHPLNSELCPPETGVWKRPWHCSTDRGWITIICCYLLNWKPTPGPVTPGPGPGVRPVTSEEWWADQWEASTGAVSQSEASRAGLVFTEDHETLRCDELASWSHGEKTIGQFHTITKMFSIFVNMPGILNPTRILAKRFL